MSRTLLRTLFSFDPRPTSEVEDEMRAEFDTHLAMLEDELAQQGLDPTTARQQALARFGDPARLSREGTAIKLGDRIMLQRINLALLIVVGAAVIFLLVQNQRVNSRSMETLEQLNASLVALQSSKASTQPERSASSNATGNSQPIAPVRVSVSGRITNPGTYDFPKAASLRDLMVQAGGLTDDVPVTAWITRAADATRQGTSISKRSLDTDGRNVWLDDGDIVQVLVEAPRNPAPAPDDIALCYIGGRVQRSGPYAVPRDGMTLKRALEVSGLRDGATKVLLTRGAQAARTFEIQQLTNGDIPDVALEGNDEIEVR